MKDSYLILLVGLGAAFYLSKKPAASTSTTKPGTAAATSGAQEITYGAANGWRYFSDGTSISPDGTYYYQGQMVWNPMM